ncbi:MAG: vWA domain-containing protein [Pseudomonadota bacterium]
MHPKHTWMARTQLLVALIAASLVGCDGGSPPVQGKPVAKTAPKPSTSTQAQPTPTPSRSATGLKDYGTRALDNSWPALEQSTGIESSLQTENYYLVFDGSGSMKEADCSGGEPKLNVAKRAVGAFVRQIPNQANVGLFVFDKRGWGERVKIGPNRHEQVVQAVDRAVAGAGTPLNSAIAQAYVSLTQQAQRQLGYGEFHIVVITDGRASQGQDPRPVVDQLLAKSPIVLHTIGFCISGNHSLNQASRTYYRQAGDAQALARGLEAVLAEEPDFQVRTFAPKG